MRPELVNCLTWLANAVGESVLHTSKPEHLDKDVRSHWGTLCNSIKGGNYINWQNLTVEEALELRFCRWEEESDLYLIPIWLYPFIPEDLVLTSIGGNKAFVSCISTDTRFGRLSWGILIGGDREPTKWDSVPDESPEEEESV